MGVTGFSGCDIIRTAMSAEVNHSARRSFVVERAMGLFAKMGYGKVSFMTISEATGIARTALYRYFKTKRDIFDAAIHEATSGIKKKLQQVAGRKISVPRRLELACGIVIDEFYGRRDFFSAIYEFVFSMVRAGEDMTGRIRQFTGGFEVVLRRLLEEGVSNGELRSTVDPEDAAEALYALMESVALRVMLGVEKDPLVAKRRFGAVIAALAM